MKIEVTGSMGLALISLYHWKHKDVVLFGADKLQEIRQVVTAFYVGQRVGLHEYKNVGSKIEFTLPELEAIEQNLPLYGLGEEIIFTQLRREINKALCSLDTKELEDMWG